jgi:hypothetical protein
MAVSGLAALVALAVLGGIASDHLPHLTFPAAVLIAGGVCVLGLLHEGGAR